MDYGDYKVSSEEDYAQIIEDMRNDRAQLVDIREIQEWEQARFECAIHVPLSDLSKGIGVDILKEIKATNKKIYLHCFSGSRVQMAKTILGQFGCQDFSIIPFSMMQMLEKGFKPKQ
jgi:rhodanese-related sulfurtransferase